MTGARASTTAVRGWLPGCGITLSLDIRLDPRTADTQISEPAVPYRESQCRHPHRKIHLHSLAPSMFHKTIIHVRIRGPIGQTPNSFATILTGVRVNLSRRPRVVGKQRRASRFASESPRYIQKTRVDFYRNCRAWALRIGCQK